MPQGYSDKQGAELLQVLQDASPSSVELRRIEFVGPQVGEELREQGGLAMLLALMVIGGGRYLSLDYYLVLVLKRRRE